MNATPADAIRPKPKRRWFQFRLRSLLLVTAACAVVFSLWTTYVSPYQVQHQAKAALTELGAYVISEPAGTAWLRKFVGDEYLVNVTVVGRSYNFTDSGRGTDDAVGLNNPTNENTSPVPKFTSRYSWTTTSARGGLVYHKRLERL